MKKYICDKFMIKGFVLKAVIVLIATALVLSCGVFDANAAAQPKLSKKKLSIPMGAATAIKVKNPNKKVRWSSSNNKVVKIVKTSGKRKKEVRILALKKGSCYIKAKVGKKTLKCKVNVKTAGYRTAAGNFAFNMLRETIKEDQSKGKKTNTLVSPDSILTALAMTELGAEGATKKEMEKVLGSGINTLKFNSQLAAMHQRIMSNNQIKYFLANSIWVKKNYVNVKQSFIDTNKAYHGVGVFEEAFDETTVANINKWVSDNTQGMIDKIIENLDEESRLVLVNSLAFDGEWEAIFDSSVTRTFTRADGVSESADMMYDTAAYEYFELNGGKAFVKKYAGESAENGGLAFVGILPPKGKTVDKYLKDITGYEYIKAWDKRKLKAVSIGIPKFKYDYGAKLKEPLKRMGIKKAFHDFEADFNAMINSTPEKRYLKIGEVYHKTHIEMYERGTKAAAATAVEMIPMSVLEYDVKIHLDRPFVYAIVDTKTGIPLFMGVLRSTAASAAL